MSPMLTIQRRHSKRCPDRNQGPDFLKCRGRCPLRVCGMVDGRRIRKSLKTRDQRRALRRLAEMQDEALTRPRKKLTDAIEAFHAQHEDKAPETKRKYRRVLSLLSEYCERGSFQYLDQMTMESLDKYGLWRRKENSRWIKEIEVLRQFFNFCRNREWTTKNPAMNLVRPKLLEANDIKPFTQDEVVRIIAASDFIGRSNYERLRARAMVLLMRYEGLRISDVVTLSRDHIQDRYIVKRAVKNHRIIRVELHPEAAQALELSLIHI